MSARLSRIGPKMLLLLLVTAVHGLVLWVFWRVRAPTGAETESFISVLFFVPATVQNPIRHAQPVAIHPTKAATKANYSESSARENRPTKRPKTFHTMHDAASSKANQEEENPNTAPLFIDWAKEAEIAAADRVRQDAMASRQAAALIQWRLIPSAESPDASDFSWDEAQTHRVETSPLGMLVKLNDRCSVLISVYFMEVKGGCKLGELSVHGDLFTHMSDASGAGDQAAHY